MRFFWYYVLVYFGYFASQTSGFNRNHCNTSLGMEGGGIGDEQIVASSAFFATVGATQSRLNNVKGGGAWCPKNQISAGSREYLEIDFLNITIVTKIATQGRHANGKGQEYMEEFIIEYYRPKLGQWKEYKQRDGKRVLTGNSDTKNIVVNKLEPAVIASKIRIVPYSVYLRTVCARVEFYGCVDNGDLLSYTLPQSTDVTTDLLDTTYDGTVLNDETLVDGLGKLADGEIAVDSNSVGVGIGTGSGWVAWRNITFSKKYIELLFEFGNIRNFSHIDIYTSNSFSKNTQIFGRASIYFYVEDFYTMSKPVLFHPRADLIYEKARYVTIPINPGVLAKLVKIRLYFVKEWIMIAEVYFTSELFRGNISKDDLQLVTKDERPPKFDKNGDIILEGYLSNVYKIYFFMQYTLGIIISIGIITGLCYIVYCLIKKKSPTIDHRYNTRRFLYRRRLRRWIARWTAQENNSDNNSENLEPVLIPITVGPPNEITQYEQTFSKPSLTKFIKTGYITNLCTEKDKLKYQITERSDNLGADPIQPQFEDIDAKSGERYYIGLQNTDSNRNCNLKDFNTAQNASYDENISESSRRVARYHCHNTRLCLQEECDEEENKEVEFRRIAANSQVTLKDRIEYLLINRGSLSMSDKIKAGDNLWNIGASGTAPKIYPQGELVPIPLSGLMPIKKFCSSPDQEITICTTEKLTSIMKHVPAMVAVRMAKMQENEDCVEYFQEVRLLASLSHPGLCNIIGIVTTQIPPLIVQEFTPGEDLCHHLSTANKKIPFQTLIHIITQICCSMRYLESVFMVHRDLAARNCLIYPNNRIKVTDLAMYSNAYNCDYYHTSNGKLVPLRWLSWEAALLGRSTCASTVWSFGITSWEILNHCNLRPYAAYSDAEVISLFESLFFEGHTGNDLVIDAHPRPTKCPSQLYTLLKRCWQHYEEERPTFDEILNFLAKHFQTNLPFEYAL